MENNRLLPETITTLGINCEYAERCYVIGNVEHNYNALETVRNHCSQEGLGCDEKRKLGGTL